MVQFVTKMILVKSLRKLNEQQIKAIANLLLEIGKWLLLAVVFSSLFTQEKRIEAKEIIIALMLAFAIIVFAIFMLREVKKNE